MENLSEIFANENKESVLQLKQWFLVRRQVKKVGIPANFIGYKYIIEALRFMINSQEPLFLDEVYDRIAKFNKTSKASVEVSMRNAIKKATLNKSKYLETILKSYNLKNLSNSVFLNIMKEIIIEELLTDDLKF